MTLADHFAAAVTETYTKRDARVELLPEVLAQACVDVLEVDGAGISMLLDDLRVPLGSSDETAAYAERLQTTLGQGPCLDAVASSRAATFDLATLSDRWPVFCGELVAKTPLRSIASLPIQSSEVPTTGALDLYSTDNDGLTGLRLDDISAAIVDTIGTYLFAAPSAALEQGTSLPLWLSNDAVVNRMDVWIAVGTLIELASLSSEAALAAIRAYALRHQTTLDDVAQQLADQALAPHLVLGPSSA